MKISVKKVLLSACAVVALGASPAFAAIILSDNFDRADGSLVGTNPQVGGVWTNHSGTAGQMQIASNQARVNHTLGEDANAGFLGGAIGAGTTIYSSFDLVVPTQTAAPGNVYFAHFKDVGNFFGSRVWISAPSVVGAGYRLGITGDSTLEVANDLFPADLAFGTSYQVVTSYNFDTGESRLWVDPANILSTSEASDDSFAGDEFLSYAFRQSTANSIALVDNLVVATSFFEATGVPEPTTAGLALLAGVALLGIRRKSVR